MIDRYFLEEYFKLKEVPEREKPKHTCLIKNCLNAMTDFNNGRCENHTFKALLDAYKEENFIKPEDLKNVGHRFLKEKAFKKILCEYLNAIEMKRDTKVEREWFFNNIIKKADNE